MKPARWRDRCSPVWPAAAQDWLHTKGSLTVRLQQSFGAFRVQVRYQGMGRVNDEALLVRARSGRQVRLRQVTLWAGGQPRVVAQTCVQWLGAQSDWPFWRQLGSRSLGTVLFRDRRVKRGAMQFASLSSRHPLARQAAEQLQATGRMGGSATATQRWLARRAIYQRGRARTPLVVTEVFFKWADDRSVGRYGH